MSSRFRVIALAVMMSASVTFTSVLAQDPGAMSGAGGSTSTTASENRMTNRGDSNIGWVGLAGLLGLGGLAGLSRRDTGRMHSDRTVNR